MIDKTPITNKETATQPRFQYRESAVPHCEVRVAGACGIRRYGVGLVLCANKDIDPFTALAHPKLELPYARYPNGKQLSRLATKLLGMPDLLPPVASQHKGHITLKNPISLSKATMKLDIGPCC